MLKKLLITTAVSGLMLSAAAAQYSSPSTPSAAPAKPGASDGMKPDGAKSDMSKPGASMSGSTNFISAQNQDQLLASKFKGSNVEGANNEKIGDVSDILFTKDGKIEAYIVSVGGFLGVGAKEVALAPSSVQMSKDDKDNIKLKVSLNKDQLAQAPDFQQYKSQRSTTGVGALTGSSSSSSPSSSGSSMAPSNSAPGSNPPAKP